VDDRPISRRAKALYASSSIGSEALGQSRGTWLLYYYAPPASANMRSLLPVGVAGAILFIDGLTGAFYNPVVGHWTDRTRSRLGRRIPWVLAFTPPWALFALLVFIPPQDAGTAAIAAYLFLTLELYALFSTLSGGPFQALLPEIARTSAERLSLVGYRVYCGAIGGAAGLVLSGLLVDHVGFRWMAFVMAALALVTRYVGTFGVWRRASRTAAPVAIPFRRAVSTTFRNAQFLAFVPSVVLFQVGVAMILGVLPYYVKAVLHTSHTGTWVAVLTGIAIVSMLLSVPLSARLARRTSKRHAYRRAMLGAAAVFPLLAIAGVGTRVPAWAQLALVMAIAGPPLAGVYLFPDALTADIIDEEHARIGLRREAMYYGAGQFVQQAGGSFGPFLLAGLLILGDTSGHQVGLRLVGPVAGLLVLVAYLIFRRYELPDDVEAAPAVGSAAPT
jgi:GPH family glycoside/pentoside/hexuronide:cation symporter